MVRILTSWLWAKVLPAQSRVSLNASCLTFTAACCELVACATPMTVGQSFKQFALEPAAFEMQCPKQDIEVLQLNRPLTDPAYAGTKVGVRGCGKQAVYVLSYGAGWVTDSELKSQEQATSK